MTILLTRPLEDSLKLAESLNAAGFNSFVEPMFDVKYLPHDELDKALSEHSDDCSIIFTSKHAIPTASPRNDGRVTKCFAIKGKTTVAAQKVGFCISASAINVRSLVERIKAEADRDKVLLYARGRKISLDLKKVLEADGFRVKEFVVYETVERAILSDELLAKLRSNEIKLIPFYSRNTVDIFARLVAKTGLHLKDVVFLSISKKLQIHIKNTFKSKAALVFDNETGLLAAIREVNYSSLIIK